MSTDKLNNRFTLPEYREIPDVGLYLDQIVKYINSFLQDQPQMQVTGSMLSNYVKMKLVPKAVRKMYSRDQICMLFFIVLTKRALSIEQTGRALSLLNSEDDTKTFYERFRSALLLRLTQLPDDQNKEEDQEDPLLSSITSAVAHCMYLDQYFREVIQEA